jgi:threonine dehydratase
MHMSRTSGKAEWCPDGGHTDTIAHGLAPPFAGRATFNHVAAFVDDLVLVTDDEMRHATRVLFAAGLVAEVSGAAAVAAVLSGKCGDLSNKKVVCTVSGRNIDIAELMEETSLPDQRASM